MLQHPWRNESKNPLLFEILQCLDAQGILGLINTSFNTQGEPIVHTDAQAIASAQAMGLDGVVVGVEIRDRCCCSVDSGRRRSKVLLTVVGW